MLSSEYYESLAFGGHNFNVSEKVSGDFLDRLHWHPFVEILISLADGNEASINFTRYPMGMNDILLISPGDLHAIHCCRPDSMLVIQFSRELLTVIHELDSCLHLLAQTPYLKYAPSSSESDRMVGLLKEFCEFRKTQDPLKEVRMYSLLLDFFRCFGNICLRKKPDLTSETGSTGRRTIKKIAEACLFISQNCTQPLTLEDAAEHIGVSKSHFAHLFRAYTNTTFVDFLTEERIKRAQAFFRDPEKQVIDVAFDSGFSSISSFNRAFKKITGLSPSKFRENMIMHPD